MHCLKAGAGPELILLHGLLGTASTWELTIPRLAEESTIYAVDALGIGESERVPGIDATAGGPGRPDGSSSWMSRASAPPTSWPLPMVAPWR